MPTVSLAQCEMAQPGEVVTTSLMRLPQFPRYLKFACPYAEILCLGARRGSGSSVENNARTPGRLV